MSFEKLFETLATLPVAAVADDVVTSVLSDKVTILSSATGSGKTLFVSSLLAEVYQTMSKEPVIVVVPRRYLAQNAAETVCQIIGCDVGGLVGYAVGSQSGDKSFWNREQTKLLFVTSGYAIASGLIHRANLFVLDEVHETTMDLSIIRALLHRRLQKDEKVKVLEMSATFDPQRQSMYWQTVAETSVFEVEGKTFGCEQRYRPAGKVEEAVIELIREGRTGILVFRPGKGEVEETVEEITKLAAAAQLPVDVAQIHGDMDFSERSASTKIIDGKAKVLVGTNVIESGVNFPWVDGGVSCGTGKENNVRPVTGATFLELVDLPQWRLDQQEGRVKRFRPGIFVLCSPKPREEREKATKPEILRLALTELVLHCASFGLRTDELNFDYVPENDKVIEAEQKLQRLGLIDSDCQLTEAGEKISDLPVGPETGAMLWHAMKINCLPQAITLAAVIEVGGLRKDYRSGHYLSSESDWLDAVLAMREVVHAKGPQQREVREARNVSYKRYQAAYEMGRTLQDKLKCQASFDFASFLSQLRQCVFAGSLDKLYLGTLYADKVTSLAGGFRAYSIGRGSCCERVSSSWLVAGDLRVITPRNKMQAPFTVLEKVTIGTLDDVLAVAKVRPEILTEERAVGLSEGRTTYKLFGQYPLPAPVTQRDSWGDDGDFEPYNFSRHRYRY